MKKRLPMANNIFIQNISKIKSLPSKRRLKTWIDQALSGYDKNYEILIRFVGSKEITKLNKKYRKKNKPTNIISFPFEPPPGVKTHYLGDLVICLPLVKREAKEQHKTFTAHLAHLVIHGTLHLLGYEHKLQKETAKMEALEVSYLKKLGFANPYKYWKS